MTHLLPIILFKVLFCYFNTKSNLWFMVNKAAIERSKIDGNTSTFGLQQIINEPTDIIGDSSSSIDLIFSLQPNLVMESGVHSSLHPDYHHQITYAKFNLRIYCPPPYEREYDIMKKLTLITLESQ